MSTPPTMRQIAEKAGVDRSTVSLALRDDPRLRPETCVRIQDIARQMGYRKNPTVAHLMAQLRAGQQAHFQSNLALFDFGKIPYTQDHMFIRGAVAKASSMGYGIDFFRPLDLGPHRLEQILIGRGIRGVMICHLERNSRLPERYDRIWREFSCCVSGMHPTNPPLSFVSDDNYMTSMAAVRHLRAMGFTRIGLAMHAGINIETEYRFIGGYTSAHREGEDLKHPPILILEPEDRKKFLVWYRRYRPEIVVCVQKNILSWLREEGIGVPEEVQLAHLDVENAEEEWAGMQQNTHTCGAVLVEMVVNSINHNSTGAPDISRGTLIESCWRPGSTVVSHSSLTTPAV